LVGEGGGDLPTSKSTGQAHSCRHLEAGQYAHLLPAASFYPNLKRNHYAFNKIKKIHTFLAISVFAF
jgi:hypothetical protein